MLKLILPLLATLASARVMDKLPGVPRGWTQVRAAHGDEAVTLKIAMRQNEAEALELRALEIATPGHAHYGQHLSRDALRAFTAPSAETVQGVTGWLQDFGIDGAVDHDWITLRTSVSKADQMLNTTFAWFQYAEDPEPKLRALQYSIPNSLVGSIDMIQPTTRFGQLGAKRSTVFDMTILEELEDEDDDSQKAKTNSLADSTGDNAAAAACTGNLITPDCLKSMYNINYTASADGNLVAFASYLEQYARYNDLATFQKKYVPKAVGQNFTVTLISNGLNSQNSTADSGEANLDAQYLNGVSHPIPLLEYSTGGRGPLIPTPDNPAPSSNEPYLDFLTALLAQPASTLPQTLSTSYGEEEQSVPQDYALKICNMFMQLGALGVSVLFSSGDSGPGGNCTRLSDGATFFGPTFPAGCPWVTAVGATQGSSAESAATFSSGGFSIYHAQPAYQQDAVPAYLSHIKGTYAPYFNASGRGIPDVAAVGQGFAVYDKQRLASMAGTSASSPVFAGVVALLNAARKTQGQPPLGFLNPWLYNNSAAFNDIVTGAGVGCVGNKGLPSGARWNATAGWDPVTGLGTPRFDKLLAAAAPGVANA